MNLILDTVENATTEVAFENSRAIRCGVVTDIPAQTRSDPHVLARAILEAGGPQLGEPHPNLISLRLMRIIARPAKNTNDADVQYIYEGIQGATGSGSAVLVVEDSTALSIEQESVDLDGNVIQAIATYKVKVKISDTDYSERDKPVPKTLTVPVLRPKRVLNISGFIFGRRIPSTLSQKTVGFVNALPWPSGSLWTDDSADGPGYWLCTNVEATADRYRYVVWEQSTRPYKMRASFQSKVVRDWSHFGVFRNLYGNVFPELKDRAGDIKRLIQSPYRQGQDHTINGFTRVGMYAMADFQAAFGF